jgi:hypothetical protein
LGVVLGSIVLLIVLINWKTKLHPFLAASTPGRNGGLRDLTTPHKLRLRW